MNAWKNSQNYFQNLQKLNLKFDKIFILNCTCNINNLKLLSNIPAYFACVKYVSTELR